MQGQTQRNQELESPDSIPGDPDSEHALEHDAQHVADEPPESPLPERRRRIRRTIKWAIALLVLLFVGKALWQQLSAATAQEVSFRWPWALAAVLALTGLYGALLASEQALLRAFGGVRLSLPQMMAVAWVPLAGKYIPGKVASVAAAVVLLKRAGVSTATGLSIFVVFDAVPILTGSMLAGLLLLDEQMREALNTHLPIAWTLLPATIVLGAVCIHPAVFGPLVNRVLRLLQRPPLPRVPRLRDYVSPVLWSLGQWASTSLSVFLMCIAFSPAGHAPTLHELPSIIGITALVMVASYFSAFVTPMGLGVREGLLLLLLATIIPQPSAAAVTVAMRLAHMIVEIALCAIGVLMTPSLNSLATPTASPRTIGAARK